MADWFCVVGDTRRQFTTLTDGSGAPLNLDGMTPLLRVAENNLGRRLVAARAGVLVQAGTSPNFTNLGVVAFDPAATDVAADGEYLCQWQLTDGGGKIRTVPDAQPFVWRISDKLR